MQIKQLSVFLENKGGRLNDVAKILGQAGINMSAFSLAESSDFGILRVIVSDPVKAQAILKENKFAVSLTDVICVHVPNSPGSLAILLPTTALASITCTLLPKARMLTLFLSRIKRMIALAYFKKIKFR